MEEQKARLIGDEKDLKKIVDFINGRFGIDLRYYRLTFVYRHLRGRMLDARKKNALEYILELKNNPEEFKQFLDTLSINVTHFFRDKDVYEAFRANIIPELLRQKAAAGQQIIRVWSAGCASGQEPYSLAIMLKEALDGKENFIVKIIATDVDDDALNKGMKAEYDERDFRETDKKFVEKYFTQPYNKQYALSSEIKRMVKFEKLNLITDEGPKLIDIIFCRNVLIYFNREQQDLLFKKFHGSLAPGGYFVIAKVETIWDKTLFEPMDLAHKIYKKAA